MQNIDISSVKTDIQQISDLSKVLSDKSATNDRILVPFGKVCSCKGSFKGLSAGYDCPKTDGLATEDNLKDKMQKRQMDTMPVRQPVFPSFTHNLFPYHRCL